MIREEIIQTLFEQRDIPYSRFQSRLIPNIAAESILGVRTPQLRKMAKELGKREEIARFLNELPHTYFEENQLHAFLLSGMKDCEAVIEELNRFLPYVDNWATCDQMSPKIFRKHRARLMEEIRRWINDAHTYTVRFAIGMLMEHFLEEDFSPEVLQMVAEAEREDYYVNMMRAWFFATAFAKQWDAALPFLQNHCLDVWTHNKTIQKCRESNRISGEKKEFLRQLKR